MVRPAAATDPPLLERWRLSPVYSSTYDVRRQETSWWQKLDLDRKGGLADLKSALEVKTREDPSRNNYNESDNRFSLKLGRKVDLGELTVDGDWRRRWTEDVRSVTAIDEDHMNLGSTIGLLGRERATLDFRFAGGWLRGRELKERQVGTLRTVDRTSTSGLEGETYLQGQWEPVPDLKLGSRASWDGSVQSSDSRHVEADETTPTPRGITPARWISARRWNGPVSGGERLARGEGDRRVRPVLPGDPPGAGDEGSALPLRRAARGGRAGGLFRLRGRLDHRHAPLRLPDRDQRQARLGSLGPLLRRVPARPAALAQRLVARRAGAGRHRTENQNTADYSTHSKSVEAEFRRPFGPRFVLDLRGTETLTQDIYDDQTLDKDRLRSDSFLSLTYDRGEPFRAHASYATSRTEDVNIPQNRAGQNQVQDDYRITFDYQGKLPAQIALRQNFQISATYTYYVFDETKNTLTRTNRVTTKVDVPLWPNSSLYLEHIYLRSDNGLYTYSAVTGARGYGVGAENLRQYLSAVARYRFLGMFEVQATQSFNVETRHVTGGAT